MAPISLWLVEDEHRYRDPFQALIETTDDFVLAASFESYDAIPRRLAAPDLVVMDLHLPGTSGIDATRALRRRLDVPVVVLTTSDDPEHLFGALAAGASGYVVKGAEPDRMFTALREAHDGGTYFSPSVARYVLDRLGPTGHAVPTLTKRETEVLRGLAEGHSKAGIGRILHLSPHTVDTHVRGLYRKLHVQNAAAAAARGVREGLV